MPRTQKTKKPAPYIEGLKVKEVVDIPVEDISPDDSFQYRLSTTSGDLKSSLLKDGQREPIDLTGSKPHKIVDGFRRVQAIRQIGWKTVKALVHRGMSTDEAQKLAFVKNVVRKNLSPLDKANAIQQAKRRGRKLDELAEYFNLSVKQLRRYEQLLKLPPELQKLVDKGEIPMSQAKILSDHGVRNITKWIDTITTKKLTANQLKRELRKASGAKPAGRKRQYVWQDNSSVRIYPIAVSKETPKEEREKVAEMLEDAAKTMREWS